MMSSWSGWRSTMVWRTVLPAAFSVNVMARMRVGATREEERATGEVRYHAPGNRRVRLGRDFDQIEVLPVCVLTGVVGRLDSELLSVLADQPNVRDANRIVDARLGLGTARRFESGTPARPQMFFTKLVLTSLETTKTAGMQRQKLSFNLLG